MKRLPPFIALLALLLGISGAQAQETSFATIDSLRTAAEYEQALTVLEGRAAASPNDAAVLWRLSRTRVDRAGEMEGKRREKQFRQALEEARAAVEANPDEADTHLAGAIAAGRVALGAGTKEKVKLSREVKEHADRAIALNPQSDLAYHVRGRWNYEVANLGWFARTVVKAVYGGLPDASFKKAAVDFRKAIQIHERVVHHLELGKAYAKLDRETKARAQFKQALALPGEDPDDPKYKQEARKRMADL